MNNNKPVNETIDLVLPLNGAYVSAARLTVASIANRTGFDVDEIEDLKAAVSEACIYIIKQSPSDFKGTFKLTFLMYDDALEVQLNAGLKLPFDKSSDEMGIVMIRALMDEVGITESPDNTTTITMTKNHIYTEF